MGEIRVVLIFNEDNERQREIGRYPKNWKDSFGLSVEEHKKALETNITDGYIEFSATR